jgi:Zn-dependent membrane protease YugP
MYWFDPMYFAFTLPPLILGMIANWWVKAAYRKGLQVPNRRHVTGMQAADALQQQAGLYLQLTQVSGELRDSYDPRSKTLALSSGVASSASVGALAIVAHEMGHAMQDEEDYGPMRVRSVLVAPVNVGTKLGSVLFLIGFLMSRLATGLAEIGRYISWIGIFGFCLAALFALVTLPIELNASRRGLTLLGDSGLVVQENMGYARRVLRAAALTYIAALAQALAQVLYYVFLLRGRRRRR